MRNRILVADNDARLFSGPLRAELDPTGAATDDRIAAALEAASAADVVEALPDGLDTRVAERGREFPVGSSSGCGWSGRCWPTRRSWCWWSRPARSTRTASVNPADWHVMRGVPRIARLSFGARRPNDPIQGCDVAGQVDAVGKDVRRSRPATRSTAAR